MFADDRSYYEHRVQVEIQRAEEAATREAMSVHYQLAEAYRSKLGLTNVAKPDGPDRSVTVDSLLRVH